MKHGKTRVHYVPMTTFSDSIVLRSVWRSSEVGDAMGSKIFFHCDVLAPIIRVSGNNRFFKIVFNSDFEFGEDGKNIRFMTNRI